MSDDIRWAEFDLADAPVVSRHRWRRMSTGMTSYAITTVGDRQHRRTVLMHRLILGIVDEPSVETDHKNGNGLDNRRSNLRLATSSQNKANQRKRSGKSSRWKGVHWAKADNRWVAQCVTGGRLKHLGCFADEDAAGRAYDAAALAEYGEFARLNFPVGGRA